MSVTDEIKARIDLVSYVRRHVPSLKKAGRNHKACCPFHNEKTPSFIVNPERQTWHCFGACSEGGDIFTFAQKANGWDFKEALRELAAEAGVQLKLKHPERHRLSDQSEQPAETPQEVSLEHDARLRNMLSMITERYHRQLFTPDGSSALTYVREQRGINDETIGKFRIGVAPDRWDAALNRLRALNYKDDEIIEAGLAVRNDKGRVYDRFRNRLMIPIRDEKGQVVGFGGRALDPEDKVKYINSPQSALFNKSKLLFGLDMGVDAIRKCGMAVIVEGYMDVIQAHQAGYCNVVAQMGTALTNDQIGLITPRYTRKIVLALDADEAGKSAADRGEMVVQNDVGPRSAAIHFLKIPAGKDPDDLIRSEPKHWAELVAQAEPAERAIEPYCLSLLLKNPNLLYLVNRRLRELAGGDDDLLRGPLRALGVEDFTQSEYRILMAHLQDSMAQDGRETLEYLESVIGDDLQAKYEALLVEPPEAVSQTLRRNFQVDLNDIFRRRLFRSGGRTTEGDELISRALELRLARLENERIEMQYLQEEAQAGGDGDQRHNDQLNAKIILSMRAKARINRAVSRRSLPTKQASIS